MGTSPARHIRTSTQQTACDVCGRTLLRGERAEIYLSGPTRHSVCELCTSRALHGGWVREGTIPDYGERGDRVERRRSLLRRRRNRREVEEPGVEAPPPFGEEPARFDDPPPAPLEPEPAAEAERPPAPEWPETSPRQEGRRGRRRRAAAFGARSDGSGVREPDPVRAIREPRHVHAVPTSVEHKIEAAIEVFNGSEHPRTVAGITRSLGLPDVSVHPSSPVAAIVHVIVAWELCWYRYEIDLSEEVPTVRGAGQGYEVTELNELEGTVNATADEAGRLEAGAPAQ